MTADSVVIVFSLFITTHLDNRRSMNRKMNPAFTYISPSPILSLLFYQAER